MVAVLVLGRLAGTVVIDIECRLIESTRKPAMGTKVDALSIKVLRAKAIDSREICGPDTGRSIDAAKLGTRKAATDRAGEGHGNR